MKILSTKLFVRLLMGRKNNVNADVTLVWLHVENNSGQENERTGGTGTGNFWIGCEAKKARCK